MRTPWHIYLQHARRRVPAGFDGFSPDVRTCLELGSAPVCRLKHGILKVVHLGSTCTLKKEDEDVFIRETPEQAYDSPRLWV